MLLKIVIVYEKGLKFDFACDNIYIDYFNRLLCERESCSAFPLI